MFGERLLAQNAKNNRYFGNQGQAEADPDTKEELRALQVPAAEMQHPFFVQQPSKYNQCDNPGNGLIILYRDKAGHQDLQYQITNQSQDSLVRFHMDSSSLHAIEMAACSIASVAIECKLVPCLNGLQEKEA